ncbi:MAG: hypothetical protein CMF59_09705 [Leptospiraceae bacterium]|nr:hypothetical protein [Leptospiraceae bacterium]
MADPALDGGYPGPLQAGLSLSSPIVGPPAVFIQPGRIAGHSDSSISQSRLKLFAVIFANSAREKVY